MKKTKPLKKQALVHFPPELIIMASAKAKAEGTTVSEIIRRLVSGWVKGSVFIHAVGAA